VLSLFVLAQSLTLAVCCFGCLLSGQSVIKRLHLGLRQMFMLCAQLQMRCCALKPSCRVSCFVRRQDTAGREGVSMLHVSCHQGNVSHCSVARGRQLSAFELIK
jgi:hypothetical protein